MFKKKVLISKWKKKTIQGFPFKNQSQFDRLNSAFFVVADNVAKYLPK